MSEGFPEFIGEPLIDILLATYNGGKYLTEQIESLLSQSVQEWRLIIHDDGSTDDTVNIIINYCRKYPDKIIIINDGIKAGGAKFNFSHLMKFSTAEYIMFCDQDDVWIDNKIYLTLNKMIELEKINQKLPILVHTDLTIVDSNLNVLSESMFNYQKINYKHGDILKNICFENMVTGCTMMINKSLLALVGNIPDEAIMHDWWISIIALKNGGKVGIVDKVTIMYRQHGLNAIGAKKIDYKYYMENFLSLLNIYSRYKRIYIQYKKADVDIHIGDFVINKFFMTIMKMFR